MRAWMAVIGLACAFGAQAAPKVAVTDLAYEAQVEEYIHSVNAQNSGQSSMYNASQSSSYSEYESNKSYIQQTELRKFGGDIKGEILKTGMFELIQGKPYTAEAEEDVYDVIRRIKNGAFEGADYVLFGTLSDIDFQEDVNALAHTDSYSKVLGLSVVADFSLIDTRTLQITSAFTAMGEGQDTKLMKSQDRRVTLNRPKVVREVSKALGEDVAQQLADQLGGVGPGQPRPPRVRDKLPPDEPARILN
ncbi:penicillin-binding protein activator LpoB [Pseudomonas sichuanensis]|uniref:penicillin-binding protein activator LpoB n=1 Tax=Pseudomonas TaxID=286 RepID=UPI00129BC144|nr:MULTISPECIES: penicillin-binding protein activator LpoB [Pseudomonas]MDH0731619.1 penicillin-binding protein activator LpoB [Pseudomonas sichuanensis]MDH1585252.1 penicillin-binding protein activator LpoB [Pseudomonas sichuanensis]MDH1592666.1 penicillin-binding protein activator LpoB [Pseudomonas sichuanensis]MDH1598814.1 penicillin-binding protein activator LpoB [Pseudomonas sichuanensis]MDU9401190.1 penicillin-binding protein activator LpoB [Pseudomonas sp. zfem004]